MLENIEVLYHSSIRISKNKVIYIDPFKIVLDTILQEIRTLQKKIEK